MLYSVWHQVESYTLLKGSTCAQVRYTIERKLSATIRQSYATMPIQCVFLDRDGVLNEERADYVKNWNEFKILPGVFESLHQLSQLDVRVIIITNQSAIGRGSDVRV